MKTSCRLSHSSYLNPVLMLTLGVGLSACVTPEYVINSPQNGSQVSCTDATGQACKVDLSVQWKGVSVAAVPDLYFDNAPRPGVLTPTSNAVVGQITAPTGMHDVLVSGALSGQGGVATYSATSHFEIIPATGSFAIVAQPNALIVERGGSGTTQIKVTRTPPFTAPVALALTAPPSGISAAVATAGSGVTSVPLNVAVSTAVLPGSQSLTVGGSGSGSGSGVTASTPLRVLVGRTTGAFAEASPTPYTSPVPSSASSLSGGLRVDVALGGPSLPTGWRKATYFQGAQQIGQPVGFTIGTANSLAGAGFCANGAPSALTRGVVMSGMMPSYPSQNVFQFVDLSGNGNGAVLQVPVDQTVQQGNVFHSFQPVVYFSPDCTIALVAAADKLGPAPNLIQLWDLQRGQPLHSSIPLYTNIFQADVITANNRQSVRVMVDTNTPNAQVYTVDIP